MSPSILGVIPARLGSSRLPRKPLRRVAGRPLVQWVWQNAAKSNLFEEVVIATDSEEVARVARGFGARVAPTSSEHPSGTDRVAEVCRRPEFSRFEVIANIQGDEPFPGPDQFAPPLRMVAAEGWELATAATPLGTVAAWHDADTVKVVRDDAGGALLFSRAPIPHHRDGAPDDGQLADAGHLRHLGVYVYRRNALLRWVSLPEHRLERTERLEQLRPLAAGMRIGVAVVPPCEPGVDTPADAERAERLLRRSAEPSPVPEFEPEPT